MTENDDVRRTVTIEVAKSRKNEKIAPLNCFINM